MEKTRLELIAKGAYQKILESLIDALKKDGFGGEELARRAMKATDEVIEIMSFGNGFARSLLEFSKMPETPSRPNNDAGKDEIVTIAERLGVNLGEILDEERKEDGADR